MPNNQDKNPGNPQNPQRRSWVGTALIYLVVAAIIVFMIVLLVRPGSGSNKNNYAVNDSSIQYNINEETGEGKPTGELADILNNEYVTLLQTQVYANDAKYYEIYGEYYKVAPTSGVIDTSVRYTLSGKLFCYGLMEKGNDFMVMRYIINERHAVNVTDNTITGIDPNKMFYSAEVYQELVPSSNTLMSWLPMIIITILVLVALWFVMSRLTRGMKDQMKGASEVASSRARREKNTKIKFHDVAGCDEVKAELVELVDYFKNGEKYTRLGAKLPKGVLLVGPPGTGKTLLAKAVAGEAEVPFYSISGSDFVEMYVGVGASRVRDMFKNAKSNAPCLVFIDEIDAVGRQRGAGLGGGNDEREQTLNQLLVEMDGFSDNSGVIIIAATNRADVLDPALLRAGRFDRQITVDLPDKDGREAIFKVHARGKKVAAEVDFGALASRTTGFSGADIANIMNDAAILAVRAHRGSITIRDIDEAIDRSIAGPAKSNKSMLPQEKRSVAFHESGHAIIGIFLPHSDKVQKVTIIPRGRTGGHVMMTPEQDRFLLTENELKARITGYLGGRTSEEIFFGDVSTGASNDIEMATRLAKAMVTQYGMSSLGLVQYGQPSGSVFLGRDYGDTQKDFSTQVAYEIDKEVRRIIDECHAEATKIITDHKDDVTLMAETLIKVETLTAEQISYLLEHRELPPVDEHISVEPETPVSEGDPTVENTETGTLEVKTLPYYGTAPEADKINENLKLLIAQRPECIALIAESRSVNAHNYRPTTITNIIAKFAAGRKYGLLFISVDQLDMIKKTAAELGQSIEDDSGFPVLLVETTKASIQNLIKSLSENK